MWSNRIRAIGCLALVAGLAACGGGGSVRDDDPQADGVPHHHQDIASIPEVVPRKEPRSRYGNPRSYRVFGKTYYVMDSSKGYRERGIASWYGRKFHGRRTSSGEPYDAYGMTAAHKSLPLPTYVKVTNLRNGRSIIVRVNDRGPFAHNRIIDLSYAAATKLDIVRSGTAPVEVEAIDFDRKPESPAQQTAVVVPVQANSTPAPVNDTQLYVQVGAFLDQRNAERLRSRISSLHVEPVNIHAAQLTDGAQVYRVRIGPIESVDNADALVAKLATQGMEGARIVID